eukprot:scaffold64934_cov55-Cyclotella_meneghiniana.AAC.2
MYWKNAFRWIVAQIHIIALFAADSPEHYNGYLRRGLSKAESWLRGDDSGNKYFNLRMYWQKGYKWQDSNSEKFWCIECTRSSCSKGSDIRIARCDRKDSRQQFYYDNGRIRSRKNKSMCFERKGRQIKLDSCDGSNSQKWDELSTTRAFQLRIPGNSVFCGSQHHHPKDGENVYMTSCKKSRSNKTDKWIAY